MPIRKSSVQSRHDTSIDDHGCAAYHEGYAPRIDPKYLSDECDLKLLVSNASSDLGPSMGSAAICCIPRASMILAL